MSGPTVSDRNGSTPKVDAYGGPTRGSDKIGPDDVTRALRGTARDARLVPERARDARGARAADPAIDRTTGNERSETGQRSAGGYSRQGLEPVGRVLRRARERHQLHPEHVSAATGIAPDHIAALELGTIAPLLSEFVTLTRFYGVDIDSLSTASKSRTTRRSGRRPPIGENND